MLEELCLPFFWVAVKELRLSYHNGFLYIYIYIVNNRVSPI